MGDPFDLSTDTASRRVLLLAAIALIATPLLQALSQIWPVQWDNIQWRFAAANALSSVLLLPFLGMTALVLLARSTGDRALGGAAGVLCLTATLLLAGSLVLFGLDATQLKAIVSTRMTDAFNATALRVGGITAVFALLFLLVGIAGLRMPRVGSMRAMAPSRPPGTGAATSRSPDDVGLVVGVSD